MLTLQSVKPGLGENAIRTEATLCAIYTHELFEIELPSVMMNKGITSPFMHSSIAGKPHKSVYFRFKHRDIKLCLNALRAEYGDIFWYFSKPLYSSRILIVFDSERASVIANDNVLFSKASEYWHDRDHSLDLFERLLGDSLFFSNGYHHIKRKVQFSKKIDCRDNLEKLSSSLEELFSVNFDSKNTSFASLAADCIINNILRIYYNVSLSDQQLHRLNDALLLASFANTRTIGCPYRLKQRISKKNEREHIDAIKSILRNAFEESTDVESYLRGTSSASLSHKYLVEEFLAFAYSIHRKLKPLFELILTSTDAIIPKQLAAIAHEEIDFSAGSILDSLLQACPISSKHIASCIQGISNPDLFIKRVNMCDTFIANSEISRATEIWIPLWTNSDLQFGLGTYKCPGDLFCQIISAKFLQLIAKAKLKRVLH